MILSKVIPNYVSPTRKLCFINGLHTMLFSGWKRRKATWCERLSPHFIIYIHRPIKKTQEPLSLWGIPISENVASGPWTNKCSNWLELWRSWRYTVRRNPPYLLLGNIQCAFSHSNLMTLPTCSPIRHFIQLMVALFSISLRCTPYPSTCLLHLSFFYISFAISRDN